MTIRRLKACVDAWPGCYEGGYDPFCCRFPKSCSCEVHDRMLAELPGIARGGEGETPGRLED